MGLITDTPSNPDVHTGTRRLDLWSETCNPGNQGDMAVGTGYSARYLSDAEADGYCAEISIYPILCNDGSYGVEERVEIGRAVNEGGIWRPDDQADIDYDWASQLAFETEEQAQAEADRIGQIDQSFALYLRPKEA